MRSPLIASKKPIGPLQKWGKIVPLCIVLAALVFLLQSDLSKNQEESALGLQRSGIDAFFADTEVGSAETDGSVQSKAHAYATAEKAGVQDRAHEAAKKPDSPPLPADGGEAVMIRAWEKTAPDASPAKQVAFQVYKGAQSVCPFSTWSKPTLQLPQAQGFADWEDMNLDASKSSFQKKNQPKGWELDDHIVLNTPLGQGPTLGFAAATVAIDPSKLPADAKLGLFSTARKINAVVRFSGFGGNTGLKLARLAIKMHYPEAWYNEVNWLFTETLPVFVMDDFKSVEANAKGASRLINVGQAVGFMKAMWSSLGTMAKYFWNEKILGNQSELPDKPFYSQLPYAVGQKYAMKMELHPALGDETCKMAYSILPKTDNWEADRALAFAKAIGKCDVKYDISVRLLVQEENEELIMRKATQPWADAQIIKVGSLTIPKEPGVDEKTGQSPKLRDFVNQQFKLAADAEIAHKLFRFHPIATIQDHMPIGEVNTFRAGFYSWHADLRAQTLQAGLHDALKFPFNAQFSQLTPQDEPF